MERVIRRCSPPAFRLYVLRKTAWCTAQKSCGKCPTRSPRPAAACARPRGTHDGHASSPACIVSPLRVCSPVARHTELVCLPPTSPARLCSGGRSACVQRVGCLTTHYTYTVTDFGFGKGSAHRPITFCRVSCSVHVMVGERALPFSDRSALRDCVVHRGAPTVPRGARRFAGEGERVECVATAGGIPKHTGRVGEWEGRVAGEWRQAHTPGQRSP